MGMTANMFAINGTLKNIVMNVMGRLRLKLMSKVQALQECSNLIPEPKE